MGSLSVPEDFHIIPKVKRMLFDRRREVLESGGPYDWGFAEALAFGSLLLEGMPVRLSGQDSRRGTFSHRHAFIYDVNSGKPCSSTSHLARTRRASVYITAYFLKLQF